MSRTGDSRSIAQKDRAHSLHAYSDVSIHDQVRPFVIERGEGVYVYDDQGNRYLDGQGGLWCVNVGYGRDELVNVMTDQAQKLAYYSSFEDLTNAPHAELGARLAEIAPAHINHFHLSSGGTDANETIARTMHYYFHRVGKPNKRFFISRLHSYHGSSLLTQSLSGKAEDKAGLTFLDNWVYHVDFPGLYRAPEEQTPEQHLEQLAEEFEAKILELGADNVAGFFAEPLMGAGGLLTPPPGYHKRILEICRHYDILYCSDEVVTGFGRLGHFFASGEIFGIEPDFISCAKGITSGYFPLGAAMISDRVWDVMGRIPSDGGYFAHGFTYHGHPIGCAVALRNIQILEDEKILENVRTLGPYFEEALTSLRDLRIVGDTRGSHFMNCVEYVANQQTKELFPPEVDIAKRIAQHAQAHGALVRPIAQLNILSPPLTITREHIDFLVDALRKSALAATEDLVREGYLEG